MLMVLEGMGVWVNVKIACWEYWCDLKHVVCESLIES